MKVIRSYGIEIRDAGRRTFQPTVDFYRSAVMYLIGVVNSEWGTIAEIEGANARMFSAEYLTHATKNNIPKYDFDAAFPKMPSYLRRAAIRDAVGAVSSYKSSLANWKAAGCPGKAPKLTLERNVMPSFFGGNMCRAGEEPNTVRLKLYDGHDWIWKTIKLKKTDVQYIEHHCGGMKESSPTLERRYGRYYLRCAYEENVPLSNAQLQDRLICAVDLGINTDAVCSVMKSDGTVVARRFIDFPADKDLTYTLTRRTRRAYREHGPESAGSKWSYARRLNEQLADRIAKEITAFAAEWSCDCIVFEYLDFRGRKHHGSKAQKLTMWRRNDIQPDRKQSSRTRDQNQPCLRVEYKPAGVRRIREAYAQCG